VLVVPDVYPYSVTNAGLTADRSFSKMYRWMEQRRLKNPYDALQFVINLRNLFQVAVSADRRYGPIYNLGVANEIAKALVSRGYRIGSGKPVTLLGFSGGGQVALGAATYLQPILKAPLRIVSVGGVMSDDPGVHHITRLYHLYGENDPVQSLGEKLYAGRWSWFPNSEWNQAVRAGTIEFVSMGPMAHNGAANYFGWTAFTPAGSSYAVTTVDKIGDLLAKDGLIDPSALQAARAANDPEVRAYEAARVADAAALKAARDAKKAKAA
jgi:pimeloyl-ACP methyl ester carboxylesterase